LTIGFDFTGGALPTGATLTRASSAARINITGTLVFESSNVARFDYDPTTHAARGILVENAVSNLIVKSQTFDTWTKLTGAQVPVVTANTTAAPDGTTTADTIALAATTGTQRSIVIDDTTAANVPAGQVTTSVWLKGAAGGEQPWIELVAGGSTFLGQMKVTLTTTWQRFSLTVTNPSNQTFIVGLGYDGLGGGGQTPASAATIYAWGAQLEAQAVASSYIPTTTAAAARAADVLTLNWGLLGAADGSGIVRYTFDDNSTQDVLTTVSGGLSTVPTNLSRPRIKSVSGIGLTVPDTFNNTGIFPILPGQTFPVTKAPIWSTGIATASSGRERRRKLWSYPKWRFKITHDVLRDTSSFPELQRLWAFFNAKAGQYTEFSYFDAADNAVTNQSFGTGDGVTTTFQLYRSITAGAQTFTEPVRSIAGLPTVMVNGTPTTAFTLGSNGQITFTTAPGAGTALTWTGQFMFLVRFEQDQLEAEQMMNTLWSQGGLTLVTVKK
jgi:uncharacterized protein (TIGR02217 family)